MPAESKAQRRYMAMCEHGKGKNCPNMTKKQMHDFAATSEKNLPERAAKSIMSITKKRGMR